jgi:hypothetical protein
MARREPFRVNMTNIVGVGTGFETTVDDESGRIGFDLIQALRCRGEVSAF